MISGITHVRGILKNGIIDCLDISNKPLMRIPLNEEGEKEYRIMNGMFIEPNFIFSFTVHIRRVFTAETEYYGEPKLVGFIEPILTFERIK